MTLGMLRRVATASAAALMLAAAVVAVTVPASAAATRPSVGSLSTTSGVTAGGSRITVHGTGFQHVRSVSFGSVRGTAVQVLSATRLRVTAPAHAAGTTNVRVRTTKGTSAVRAHDRFTFVAPPVVTAVTPTSGATSGGTRVTVNGTGFLKVSEILFGSSRGTALTVVSGTRLQVTAPAHTAGPVAIRVRTAYGLSKAVTADGFTYVSAPTITSVGPDAGPTGGGAEVTLTGTGFSRVGTVSFGGSAATSVTVVSATELRVVTPPHAAGPVPVGVSTAYGSSAGAPTYTYGVAPSVSYLTLDDGTASGGTRLSVVGSGFSDDAQVNFGPGSAAGTDVEVLSPTKLTVTTPAHALGVSAVQVTTRYGTSAQSAGSFFTFTAIELPSPWSAARPIDRASHGLSAISCAAPDFCAAVDRSGYATLMTTATLTGPQPLGDPADLAPLLDVSCPSPQFCAAISDDAAYVYDGSGWGPAIPTNAAGVGISQISCASPTACLAVMDGGRVRPFNGTSWGSAVQADSSALVALSCPTTQFCAAVDLAGRAVVSHAGAWSAPVAFSATSATAVACTSATSCVALDAAGKAATFDGTSWSGAVAVTGSSTALTTVACWSATACVAVDAAANAYSHDGNGWGAAVPVGSLAASGVSDISCPTAVLCVAVDNDGQVVARKNGTWGPAIPADPAGGGILTSVSCPTTSFCAAVDHVGNVLTYDGTTWTPPRHLVGSSSSEGLVAVSCTSTAFCLTLDRHGAAYRFDGTTWSAVSLPSDPPVGVATLSCATPTACWAGDGKAHVLGFDGTGWGPLVATQAWQDGYDSITSLSCPTTTYCVGVSVGGEAFTYDGATWTNPAQLTGPGHQDALVAVSCPSTSFCLAVDEDGNGYTTSNGAAWTSVASDATIQPASVSCTGATYCEAVGRTPHGYGASMTFDGTAWSPMSTTADASGFTSVSCAALGHCVAVDDVGSFFSFG